MVNNIVNKETLESVIQAVKGCVGGMFTTTSNSGHDYSSRTSIDIKKFPVLYLTPGNPENHFLENGVYPPELLLKPEGLSDGIFVIIEGVVVGAENDTITFLVKKFNVKKGLSVVATFLI